MNAISDLSKDEEAMALMLRSGMLGVPKTKSMVARELRLMAAAEEPYTIFANAPPFQRQIWRAAADMLDGAEPHEEPRTGRGLYGDVIV
jgi:hypothetical protein